MSPRSQWNGNDPVPLRSPPSGAAHRPPLTTSGTRSLPLIPHPAGRKWGCTHTGRTHATVTNLRDLPNTGKRRPLRGGPPHLRPLTRAVEVKAESQRGQKSTSPWGLTGVCMWASGVVAAASHARRKQEEAVCFNSAEPLQCTLRISKH